MTNFLNQLEAYIQRNPTKVIIVLIIIALLGDNI
jgi:hypothetical protein